MTRGFSLIELLVAVAIIGILCAVSIPQINMFMVRADRAEAVLVLNGINKVELSYRGANDTYYPTCPQAGQPDPWACRVSPGSTPSTLDVNEMLGFGRVLYTNRGWKFSWDYTGGGYDIDTSTITLMHADGKAYGYVAFLTKDMDNKPGEEVLFIPPYAPGTNDKDWMEIQSCNLPVYLARPCGVPYLNRDDLDY